MPSQCVIRPKVCQTVDHFSLNKQKWAGKMKSTIKDYLCEEKNVQEDNAL